jgi:hypothetical protein
MLSRSWTSYLVSHQIYHAPVRINSTQAVALDLLLQSSQGSLNQTGRSTGKYTAQFLFNNSREQSVTQIRLTHTTQFKQLTYTSQDVLN